MENFTPYSALAGGILIGAATALLLAMNGRLAGVSGILSGLLPPARGDTSWRLFFVAGLVIGTLIYQAGGASYEITFNTDWPLLIAGGLLTGLGTQVSGGCTSGHGVCGLARLSTRSIAATGTFMVLGALTVFVTRHVVGL